jgi:hypothetical protein
VRIGKINVAPLPQGPCPAKGIVVVILSRIPYGGNLGGHGIMKRIVATLVLAVLVCGTGAVPLRAAEGEEAKLAPQAYGVFQTYCAGCHHGKEPKSEVKDYDVLSYASLTKKRVEDDEVSYFVKAGSKGAEALKASVIWQKVGVDDEMPPKKFMGKEVTKRPSDKDKEILKKWIEAGAPKERFGPSEKKGDSRRSPPPRGAQPARAASAP